MRISNYKTRHFRNILGNSSQTAVARFKSCLRGSAYPKAQLLYLTMSRSCCRTPRCFQTLFKRKGMGAPPPGAHLAHPWQAHPRQAMLVKALLFYRSTLNEAELHPIDRLSSQSSQLKSTRAHAVRVEPKPLSL